MEAHPLAAIWPEMPAEDFKGLVADILTHGVRDPIVLLDGKILDGRHRFKAATMANTTCPTVPYAGSDPAGFVISRNAIRRHMSQVERAKAVLQCRDWRPPGRPADNGKEAGKTARELASEAGTSVRTIATAKQQLRTPNGTNRISRRNEREARPVGKEAEAEMRAAAREERLRQLEDDNSDLEERLALMAEGGTTTAQLEAWQAERKALKAQIAAWQTKYEECRRAGLAKDRELRALRKQVEA